MPPGDERGAAAFGCGSRAHRPICTRDKKLAHNEYLRKQVNVYLDELAERTAPARLGPETQEGAFLCACGYPDCQEKIELSLDEYERVRTRPHHFIVVPGHEHPTLERVVEDHGHYLVVEKHGGYRDCA